MLQHRSIYGIVNSCDCWISFNVKIKSTCHGMNTVPLYKKFPHFFRWYFSFFETINDKINTGLLWGKLGKVAELLVCLLFFLLYIKHTSSYEWNCSIWIFIDISILLHFFLMKFPEFITLFDIEYWLFPILFNSYFLLIDF